ncbi:hypothetical protein ACFSTC_00460 [Nonomuraea ferruginea]
MRDTSEGHGVRLMVAEPLSDLQMLGVSDVRAAIREIAAADALFLTGYELLHARSAEAVLEAAAVARSHSTVICLDLVPHDIHRRIPRPGCCRSWRRRTSWWASWKRCVAWWTPLTAAPNFCFPCSTRCTRPHRCG